MMKKAALIILLTGIALLQMPAQQPETTPPAHPPATAQQTPAQPIPPAQPQAATQETPAQPASPAQTPNTAQPAAPAQPQNPAQPANSGYTLRISARLVVLDMVVVDGKGAIVKDLKRDDFKVEEAGLPQTILNFEVAGAHTPVRISPSIPPPNWIAWRRMLLLISFCSTSSTRASRTWPSRAIR
jgi:hypothetical protein